MKLEMNQERAVLDIKRRNSSGRMMHCVTSCWEVEEDESWGGLRADHPFCNTVAIGGFLKSGSMGATSNWNEFKKKEFIPRYFTLFYVILNEIVFCFLSLVVHY